MLPARVLGSPGDNPGESILSYSQSAEQTQTPAMGCVAWPTRPTCQQLALSHMATSPGTKSCKVIDSCSHLAKHAKKSAMGTSRSGACSKVAAPLDFAKSRHTGAQGAAKAERPRAYASGHLGKSSRAEAGKVIGSCSQFAKRPPNPAETLGGLCPRRKGALAPDLSKSRE